MIKSDPTLGNYSPTRVRRLHFSIANGCSTGTNGLPRQELPQQPGTTARATDTDTSVVQMQGYSGPESWQVQLEIAMSLSLLAQNRLKSGPLSLSRVEKYRGSMKHSKMWKYNGSEKRI